MIIINKILIGDDKAVTHLLKLRSVTRACGKYLRLEESYFGLKWRRGFFTMRATRIWNSPPQIMVKALSITFKKILMTTRELQGIQGYVNV